MVKSMRREEHFHRLKRVFERCRAFKLRMNPPKCAFGVSSGKFLGFLVHRRGIDADPAKAIATMRPPATVKELKSFLRKVSYIQRFIPRLASITFAFTKLRRKGQSFEWRETQQTAFKRLQQIMMNLLMVQSLVHRKPLLLYLAANSYAIGALIAQEDRGGVEQPVYYISRCLKRCRNSLPNGKKGMSGYCVCFVETTPLFLGLRSMANDQVPCHQDSIAATNPLRQNIPVVVTIVTV